MEKEDKIINLGELLEVREEISRAVMELHEATNGGCERAIKALNRVEFSGVLTERDYDTLYTTLVSMCRIRDSNDKYWAYQPDQSRTENLKRLLETMEVDWNYIDVVRRTYPEVMQSATSQRQGNRIRVIAVLAGMATSVIAALFAAPKLIKQIEADNLVKTSPVVVASTVNPMAQSDAFKKFLEKAKELGKANDGELVVKIAAIQTIAEQSAKDIEHLKEVIGDTEPDEILRVVRLGDAIKSLEKQVTDNQTRQDAITSELRGANSELRGYVFTGFVTIVGLLVTVGIAMFGPFIQDFWNRRHSDPKPELLPQSQRVVVKSSRKTI